MRLFLIRHPQPEIDVGVCYGRSDVPLRQPWSSLAVASILDPAAEVVSSPLRRCTALAAALAKDYRTDDRLIELDFGDWEMRAWEAIPCADLDAWAADLCGFAGHGGESVTQLRARVREALRELGERDCVWVTHAGVIRAVFGELLQLPQAEWTSLRVDYGSVSAIENTASAARLLFVNRTA